jgi:tetratricopeptide (TPR) repeat protein
MALAAQQFSSTEAMSASILYSARRAQESPPALPQIVFENIGPTIREQIRKFYEEARKNPRSPEAVGNLGMSLQAYEYYEPAAVCYEQARALAPEDFQWIYLLATCQIAQAKHAEAVTTLREALKRKPDYVPARLKLADSLLASGVLEESLQIYQGIIIEGPDLAQARYGVGNIKAVNRDFPAAANQLIRAIELSPQYGAAHQAISMVFRELGDPGRADEHLALHKKYSLVRPPLADPILGAVGELNLSASNRLTKGLALEAEGKIEESILELERALEINPQMAQAHAHLIRLYGRTKRPDKAEQHYRAAVTINPDSALSHYNFGLMLLEQNRAQDAAPLFRRAIEINPQFAEAHLNYGVTLEQERQYDEAMKHYRIAAESSPQLRQAHFQLARMLIYKDQYQEAIGHLFQTITVEDEHTPRFVYALAAAYMRAGNKEAALKYWRQARERAAARKQTELLTLIERDLKAVEQGK